MTIDTEKVVGIFLLICFGFGVVVGVAGLGVGLLFLNIQKAIGLGLLACGCGGLLGALFGGKRIMRALIETMNDMQKQSPGEAK